MQAALHVVPFSVSQPLLVIVDPCASVILSIWLFRERYTGGPAAIAASLFAFTVMCVGVVAHKDGSADDAGTGLGASSARRQKIPHEREELRSGSALLLVGQALLVGFSVDRGGRLLLGPASRMMRAGV